MAQIINLNIIPKGIPDVVNVSQFDVGRVIQFALYDGVNVYTIPSGATVTIAGRKGDNHIFIYDATIAEGRHAVSIETTEQMTAYAGENLCQLRITKTGIDIATVNFRMMVQERPDASGDISDTDIPMIVALATEQELNAEAWAVGTKDGTAVASTDPQYHNNSKYYKEQAATSATNAANSATAAAASADHADATAADVDEAVQAVEGVVDTTYGMQDSLSIDVDGNPIEGYFAAGVADKLIVDIEPTQDLHGYDYPFIAGSTKNKLVYPYADTSKTASGVTYTDVGDGRITTSGTASARSVFSLHSAAENYKPASGSYIVSKGFTSSYIAIVVDGYNGNSWAKSLGRSGATDDATINIDYNGYDRVVMYIEVASGIGMAGKEFYPMMRLSTVADNSWIPYGNECPIVGISELDITRRGSNLFDGQMVTGNYDQSTGQPITGSAKRTVNPIYITPSNTYMFLCNVNMRVFYYTKTGTYIRNDVVYSDTTFTTPSNAYIMRFQTASDIDINNTMIYEYALYTEDLGETRYVVSIDTKSGIMTVKAKQMILDGTESYNVQAQNNNNISFLTSSRSADMQGMKSVWNNTTGFYKNNMMKSGGQHGDNVYYATNPDVAFTPSNGVLYICVPKTIVTDATTLKAYLSQHNMQIVRELGTPILIQLTPATVNLIKGYNRISTNGNTIIHLSAVPEKLINYIVNAFGTDESGRATASRAYAAKEYFYKDGFMYKVTAPIAQNAAFTEGTNCSKTTIFAELTALNA